LKLKYLEKRLLANLSWSFFLFLAIRFLLIKLNMKHVYINRRLVQNASLVFFLIDSSHENEYKIPFSFLRIELQFVPENTLFLKCRVASNSFFTSNIYEVYLKCSP
jgi:hypothetical protein